MLPDIHAGLQRLLWEKGRISLQEVDIIFESPTHERIERLVHPTINFFLFDIHENIELRQTNWKVEGENGHVTRRLVPRRIDLRYMVSALTTRIEDEHALLWRVLATLLTYPELPRDLLPEELRVIGVPIAAKVNLDDDGKRLLDVWSALNVPPHPALCYVLTAPMDLDLAIRSPLVLTRTARYSRTIEHDAEPETGTHIGGVVRSKEDIPVAGITVALEGSAAEGSVTNDTGQFTLYDVPTGTIKLRVTRADGAHQSVTLEVPAESYDIVVDPVTM